MRARGHCFGADAEPARVTRFLRVFSEVVIRLCFALPASCRPLCVAWTPQDTSSRSLVMRAAAETSLAKEARGLRAANRELRAQNSSLEAKVARLEAGAGILEARVASLEAQLAAAPPPLALASVAHAQAGLAAPAPSPSPPAASAPQTAPAASPPTCLWSSGLSCARSWSIPKTCSLSQPCALLLETRRTRGARGAKSPCGRIQRRL